MSYSAKRRGGSRGRLAGNNNKAGVELAEEPSQDGRRRGRYAAVDAEAEAASRTEKTAPAKANRKTAAVRPTSTSTKKTTAATTKKTTATTPRRYRFDISDLLSSSDGENSNDENCRGDVGGSGDTDRRGAAVPDAGRKTDDDLRRRPPLREVVAQSTSGLQQQKKTASSSTTTSAAADFDEELSQALSSLSVDSGASGAAASQRCAEKEEEVEELDESSFEFPLYGSPTRPGMIVKTLIKKEREKNTPGTRVGPASMTLKSRKK